MPLTVCLRTKKRRVIRFPGFIKNVLQVPISEYWPMFLASGKNCCVSPKNSLIPLCIWWAVWILFESINLEDRLCHHQGLMMLYFMWDLSVTIEHQPGNFWTAWGNNQPLEKTSGAATAHRGIDLNLVGGVVQLHKKAASDLFRDQYIIRPHEVWNLALIENIWSYCSDMGLDLRKPAICEMYRTRGDTDLSWQVSRIRSVLCGSLQKTHWETVRNKLWVGTELCGI